MLLSKSSVKLLDDCVKQAVAKIFEIHDNDTIDAIRQYSVYIYIYIYIYIGVIIERRPLQFANKVLDIPHLLCRFQCSF